MIGELAVELDDRTTSEILQPFNATASRDIRFAPINGPLRVSDLATEQVRVAWLFRANGDIGLTLAEVERSVAQGKLNNDFRMLGVEPVEQPRAHQVGGPSGGGGRGRGGGAG
jgi:hypothetical protein